MAKLIREEQKVVRRYANVVQEPAAVHTVHDRKGAQLRRVGNLGLLLLLGGRDDDGLDALGARVVWCRGVNGEAAAIGTTMRLSRPRRDCDSVILAASPVLLRLLVLRHLVRRVERERVQRLPLDPLGELEVQLGHVQQLLLPRLGDPVALADHLVEDAVRLLDVGVAVGGVGEERVGDDKVQQRAVGELEVERQEDVFT